MPHVARVSEDGFGSLREQFHYSLISFHGLDIPQGFLGNKYGYRPYPSVIEALEFEVLRKYAAQSGRDVALLSQWFRRDDNAVPPAFVLQPITDHFPFYADDAPQNAELRDMVCRMTWWARVDTLVNPDNNDPQIDVD